MLIVTKNDVSFDDNKLKKIKDIEETIKNINEIDNELNNPIHDLEKLKNISRKARNKFPLEISSYEFGSSISSSSVIPFDKATKEIHISRLPFYRTLYLSELNRLKNKE